MEAQQIAGNHWAGTCAECGENGDGQYLTRDVRRVEDDRDLEEYGKPACVRRYCDTCRCETTYLIC